MPIFYLNVTDVIGFTEDEEGHQLANEAAARTAAVAGLRDIAAAEIARGELNTGSFIEIINERREVVETVGFEDAVQIREGPRPRRH
jgi:hypothetical protein